MTELYVIKVMKRYEVVHDVPAEHSSRFYATINDQVLRERSNVLIQHWCLKDIWWDESKKLWQEVAYELNIQLSKEPHAALSDTFVCYVSEYGFDPKVDLAKCVPQDRILLLTRGNLI